MRGDSDSAGPAYRYARNQNARRSTQTPLKAESRVPTSLAVRQSKSGRARWWSPAVFSFSALLRLDVWELGPLSGARVETLRFLLVLSSWLLAYHREKTQEASEMVALRLGLEAARGTLQRPTARTVFEVIYTVQQGYRD